MLRCALVGPVMACLYLILAPPSESWAKCAEPLDYATLLANLDSDDQSVREMAKRQLATTVMVTSLVDQISNGNGTLRPLAGDLLARMVDLQNSEIAESARSALDSLARTDDKAVAEVIQAVLERREQRALVKLAALGAKVETAEDGSIAVFVGDSWTVGSDGLEYLTHLRNLKRLNLTYYSGDGNYVRYLGHLRNLEHLSTPQRSFKDAGMVAVAKLAHLESLQLNNTGISDDGIKYLGDLSELRELGVTEAAITDDCIPNLAQLRKLSTVYLNCTYISAEGLAELKRAQPDLDVQGRVCLQTPLSPEQRKAMRAFIHLGGQILPSLVQRGFAPAGIETHVVLADSWKGGKDGLRLLRQFDRIDFLKIRTIVTDAEMEEIGYRTSLQFLVLEHTGMTDDSLEVLKNFPNLKHISLAGPFTDAAIPYLTETSIERAVVRRTRISAEGQERLKEALRPNAEVSQHLRQIQQARELLFTLRVNPAESEEAAKDARRLRMDASSKLVAMGEAIIPLLYESAQDQDDALRLAALRSLVRLVKMDPNAARADRQEARVTAAKAALADLTAWDAKGSGIPRSAEERALLELGILGLEMFGDPSVADGYELYIGSHWNGGDEGLTFLPNLGRVSRLRLMSAAVSSAGTKVLEDLPDLKRLTIWTSDFSAEVIVHLQDLTRLDNLEIKCPADDVALSKLVGIDSIRRLELRQISDNGFRCIAQLPRLQSLAIGESDNFSGEGLRYLRDHQALQSLALFRTGCSEKFAVHLSAIPNLESLQLFEVSITDGDLTQLAKAKNLNQLNIQQALITDEGLHELANLPSLRILRLDGTKVTKAGLREFQKSRPDVHVGFGVQ